MIAPQSADAWWWWVGNALFLALLLVAALAPGRRAILAALWALILSHAVLLIFR
jgi:hypothetical protein